MVIVGPRDGPEPLALWGGPECTVNRIGDGFADQFVATGHADRPDDIALLADLGLSAVRYPVSWERISPDDPAKRDWRWADDRLARLDAAGLRVIAGLVHHGSGPAYTNLLDDGFAPGLAVHAAAVAERYPQIADWTPVNEPVTTARFSALYGHWHPHTRDEGAFWLALVNQIDATRAAMRAVRRVNPAARLIQTDDLGRTYATAALGEQAAFDNARRWMSWDLLCGTVTPDHPLWARLCRHGLADRLRAIADDPCPPDVIGINHYLTSDRFLDDRIDRYPGLEAGGNARHRYVDTEALRVLDPPPPGLDGVLREAWARYRRPLAITEVHNGCTRDEQMRWMADAWTTAQAARADGADVRAVTTWSVFGSAGWDQLLTAPGRYEPGAYDVSGGTPRPTAMVPLLKALARGEAPEHPVLSGPGWWRRDVRLHHPRFVRPAAEGQGAQVAAHDEAAPVLILGATGTLGQALAAACRHRAIAHVLTARGELDLDSADSIRAALDRHQPWLVLNAAGWVRVDDAEGEEAACHRANAEGAARLARACADAGIATAHFSSDLVFDGQADRPYAERDQPAPLGAYGRSKAAAEAMIAALPGRHLVVRTAAFFSPHDRHNFAVHACDTLARGERFAAAGDQVVTPTYVPDLCDAVLDLGIDGESGLWHLSNEGACSWAAFAQLLAEAAGLDPALIDARPGAMLGWRAARPPQAALNSERGKLMPSLADAITRFAREYRGEPVAEQGAALLRAG